MRALTASTGIAAFCSAALVGLAAGGCSSSASTSTAVAPRPSASASPTLGSAPLPGATPPSLAAKLLAPSDLPAGWAHDTASNDPALKTDCPLLNTSSWNSLLTGHAEADLNAGMTGPYLVEQLATGDAASVTAAWNKLVSGLPACTTFTHGGSNGSSTFSFAHTSLPTFGDGSYAFTLSIDVSSGVQASGYIVAARNGDSVIVVYLVGLTPPDKTFVESAVGKAVTKGRT